MFPHARKTGRDKTLIFIYQVSAVEQYFLLSLDECQYWNSYLSLWAFCLFYSMNYVGYLSFFYWMISSSLLSGWRDDILIVLRAKNQMKNCYYFSRRVLLWMPLFLLGSFVESTELYFREHYNLSLIKILFFVSLFGTVACFFQALFYCQKVTAQDYFWEIWNRRKRRIHTLK